MIGWSRNMAGLTHRACDYGHAESQLIKSTVLSDVMPLSKNSVLDVGCGFADYAAFLEQRFDHVSYTGIDVSQAMVNAARKLQPNLTIRKIIARVFACAREAVAFNSLSAWTTDPGPVGVGQLGFYDEAWSGRPSTMAGRSRVSITSKCATSPVRPLWSMLSGVWLRESSETPRDRQLCRIQPSQKS